MTAGRGGGTGRRTGLKILGPARGVWVRHPPPALKYDAVFEGTKAIDITTTSVERYKTLRLKEKAAPATVNRELASLKSAPTAPIVVIHRPPVSPKPAERAVASTDGHVINVYADGAAWHRCSKGRSCVLLAAALAHEAYHVVHGPDEASAYAEQVRVLRALGARRRDVEAVERAMCVVLGRVKYGN